MKLFAATVFSLVLFNVNAQYYYNDVISNAQSNKQYTLLKQLKIKKVMVTSFNADGTASEGFALQQEFDLYWKKMATTSSTITGASSTLNTTYENNKVKRTEEIIKGVQNKTEYSYDELGRLKTIASSSTDTALKYQSTETHIWFYNANNTPLSMLKIKNGKDTTTIELLYDEQGNVAEERWRNKGLLQEIYYYYYNDKKQLTDVVRFNQRVKKLLPDYLFEYDISGLITQTTQVPAGSSNYTIWKYTYNDKGLKQAELCFNKQKELVGKIVYSYEF